MHIFNLSSKGFRILSLSFLTILFTAIMLCTNSFACFAETTTYTQDVYHAHTGDTKYGGGCYNVAVDDSYTYEERCPGNMVYFPDYDKSQCSYCGAAGDGDQSYRDCYYTHPVTVTTRTYELGCKKSTRTVMGQFTVTKNTSDWAKEVELTMSVDSGITLVGNAPKYYVNNESCQSETFIATQSGNYSLRPNTTIAFSAPALVVSVDNIDITGPVLTSYTSSPLEWTTQNVSISLSGAKDLQPDGTAGCGLHDKPYSYDNGQTWTAKATHEYNQNGQYSVIIRDRLGNTATASVNVTNIDREAPRITNIGYDTTLNVKSVVITVSADDIMSNGSKGSGLAEAAYSFDKGATWQSDNTFSTDRCGVVEVMVRDRLGNVQNDSISVNNIDCFGPVVSHTLTPSGKTTSPVTATITAEDFGPDDNPGIGLPNDCYSFDNGETWTEDNEIIIPSNGTKTVLVRDINGNITSHDIIVSSIYVPEIAPVGDNNNDGDNMPEYVPQTQPIPDTPALANPLSPAMATTSRPKAETTTKAATVTPFPTSVNSPAKPKTEKKTTVIKTQNIAADNTLEIESIDSNDRQIKDFIILASVISLGVIGTLLIIWLLYRMVTIRNMVSKDKYAFKGIRTIRKRDTFEVSIPQKLLDTCTSGHFKLHFSGLFVTLHEGENIIVYLPDNQSYIVQPGKSVDLKIR